MAYTAQLKQVYRYSIDAPKGTTHAKITSPIHGKGMLVTLIPHQLPYGLLELDLSELHLEELGSGIVPDSVTCLHLRNIPAIAVFPPNPFTLILDYHNPGVHIPSHATVYIRHAPGDPIPAAQPDVPSLVSIPVNVVTDQWLTEQMAYIMRKANSDIAEQLNCIMSEFRSKIRLANSQGIPFTNLSVYGMIRCDAADVQYDVKGFIQHPWLRAKTDVMYPTLLCIRITHK